MSLRFTEEDIETIFCKGDIEGIKEILENKYLSKYEIDFDDLLIKALTSNDRNALEVINTCANYGHIFDMNRKRLYSRYGNLTFHEYLFLNGDFHVLEVLEHDMDTENFDCDLDNSERVISFIPTHLHCFILTKYLNSLINREPDLWLETVEKYIHLNSDTIAKAILILHRKGLINFSYTNKNDIFYACNMLEHSEEFQIEIMYIFDDNNFLNDMLLNAIKKGYDKLATFILTRLYYCDKQYSKVF